MASPVAPKESNDRAASALYYGYLESLSLGASYNFESIPWSSADLEQRKTRYHEFGHLLQATTTSYGYYVASLRMMQANAVLELARYIRDELDLSPKRPLAKYVYSMKGTVPRFSEMAYFVNLWFGAEWLIAYLEGQGRLALRMPRKFSYLSGITFAKAFARMDLELENQFVAAHLLSNPVAFETPSETEESHVYDHQMLHRPPGNVFYDVRAVLEGAATAAEFWGESDETAFNLTLEQLAPVYGGYLRMAIDSMPSRSMPEVVFTFLAIADIALNPPVLPHQRSARQPGYDLLEMHPTLRLQRAMTSLSEVGPAPMNPVDYGEWTDALFADCQWTKHSEVIKSAVARLGDPDLDRFDDWLFARAQIRADGRTFCIPP